MSEAGSSGAAAAGSKDHLLRAPGHGCKHLPVQLVVFACAFEEMESTKEGHGIALDELGMLREEVTGRPEALRPGETVMAFVEITCLVFFVFNVVCSSY